MTKNELQKEIKELTKQLDKQIKTLKGKTIEAYESEKVQAVLTKLQKKSIKFLESVKNKVNNLWDYYSDPDEIEKIIKNVKVISKNVYKTSLAKFNEVKNNKDVKKAVASVESFLKKTYDKTSVYAKKQFDKAMQNKNVKKAFDGAVSTYDDVKDIVTDYFEKPEVQKNVKEAKKIAADLAEKSVTALKKWLDVAKTTAKKKAKAKKAAKKTVKKSTKKTTKKGK